MKMSKRLSSEVTCSLTLILEPNFLLELLKVTKLESLISIWSTVNYKPLTNQLSQMSFVFWMNVMITQKVRSTYISWIFQNWSLMLNLKLDARYMVVTSLIVCSAVVISVKNVVKFLPLLLLEFLIHQVQQFLLVSRKIEKVIERVIERVMEIFKRAK